MVTTQKPETVAKSAAPDSLTVSPGKPSSRSSETDKLRRSWRALITSIVVATRASDKVAARPDAAAKTELDEAVEQMLRARSEFRRHVSVIEAKLMGQAAEMEALAGHVQSQPRLGKRKRRETENGAPHISL